MQMQCVILLDLCPPPPSNLGAYVESLQTCQMGVSKAYRNESSLDNLLANLTPYTEGG